MSKKTIVLADNSYTIRRIVELSFSEEEDIELTSFENSLNLREKLLELKPAIVLVDIKLPEFNGYEVCRFVNKTESLKHTQVFLLKGGFEPVDENILKDLRFVDIITKPFDSNSLVSTIKNLLIETSTAAPPPATEEISPFVPEDLPEIDNLPAEEEEISFSDIKEEIQSDIKVTSDADKSPGPYPDEEVLPSEEITQGTQQEKNDSLDTSAQNGEDLENPFKDEMPAGEEGLDSLTEEELNIKRNIEQEERELDIGSLTQEAISIKMQIGDREKEMFKEPLTQDEIKVPEEDSVDMFPFGKPKEEEILEPPPIPPPPEVKEIPDLEAAEVEKEMGLEADKGEIPPVKEDISEKEPEEKIPDYDAIKVEIEPEPSILDYEPPSPFEDKVETTPMEMPPGKKEFLQEEPGAMEYEVPAPPAETVEPPAEIPPAKEEALQEESAAMEYEVPAPPAEPEEPPAEIPPVEEKIIPVEEVKEAVKEGPEIEEEILTRVEDKLTITIKEILWEIVPPLAEKIITEEIVKIKEEVSKSFK